jgi:small conductance mechanosensitive channel
MDLSPQGISNLLTNVLLPALRPILIAIVAWVIGRKVIGFVTNLVQKSMERNKLDATAARYLSSVLGIAMTIGLVLGIISLFGIETAGFAGLLAGAGLAIGTAVSGQLSNFASGLLMLVLRPFKVGDAVRAGGVEGVVREIGLLGTTIDTGDNLKTLVGNGKVFGDTIVNYTANPWRAIVIKTEIDSKHDHVAVMRMLEAAAAQVPNVVASPAPAAGIADLKGGPVIALQANCHNDHFLQVGADLHRAIYETLKKNGIGAPVPVMRTISA